MKMNTYAPKVRPEIQFLLDAPASHDRISIFGGFPSDAANQQAIATLLRTSASTPSDSFPISETWEFTVGSRNTRVRGYRPRSSVEAMPIVVEFHGGGWVYGSIDTNDQVCRGIANSGECLVFNVDYGLAPENPFPEPLNEAIEAVSWIVDNAAALGGDPSRVVVSGQSAGGNLAGAVALHSAQSGDFLLAGQVLAYPALDATCSSASYRENAEGYLLSAKEMQFYWQVYNQRNQDPKLPALSPLFARDLAGLPPTFLITTEFDVLRDEGEAYAERLAQAGVPTVYRCYEGQIHGLLGLGSLTPDASHAISEIGAWLRRLFS